MREGLLRTHRNDVLLVIEQSSFPVDAFYWGTKPARTRYQSEPEQEVTALIYKHDPNYFFAFDPFGFSYYSPGVRSLTEAQQYSTWLQHKRGVAGWLKNLAREAHVPDLWAEFSGLTLERGDGSNAEDEPLTPEERGAVLGAIDGVRALLEARDDVAASEHATMNGLLDRIANATETATRGQFGLVVWGAVAGALAAQLLTPANGKWLLGALQTAVTWLPPVVRAMLAAH
jgi:hypothetical protein